MSDRLFVCRDCGGVDLDDCRKCPDRGDGRGVTVGQIKRALLESPDRTSLEATRSHYARYIGTLKHSPSEDARTMGKQIANLVDYLRHMFTHHPDYRATDPVPSATPET